MKNHIAIFTALLTIVVTTTVQAQTHPYKLFFEKVYLHTDRAEYLPGDTIWFKAYLVNAQNNKPIGTSNNLYVELIQTDSAKMAAKEIIRLDNGLGNGDIMLPDSLRTGKYSLRAYTNWMRNFGDNFIFEKAIDIINIQAPKKSVSKVGAKTPKPVATASPNISTIKTIPAINFYPEGGSLVEGVCSVIAVKSAFPIKASVLNNLGDTITHFKTDSLGMGLLALLPLKGQHYEAVYKVGTSSYQAALSEPLLQGFTLATRQNDTLLTAVVSCNDATLKAHLNQTLSIDIRHSGELIYREKFQLKTDSNLLHIPLKILPEGMSSITLSDEEAKPNCERLVYIPKRSKLNNIKISTDKSIYNSRSKVTLQLKLSDTTARAALSVAVVDAGIVPVQPENIQTYLMLQSELKGEIQSPTRYFDTTNVNRYKQLDLLLMTQGWRDFIWRRLADSAIRISYEPEDGINITGKVKNEKNDKAMPGINVSLYAPAAKGTKLFAALTDSVGMFAFRSLLYYGEQPAKLSSTNMKGDKKGTIYINTPDWLSVNQKPANEVLDSTANQSEQKAIKRYTSRYLNTPGVKQLKEVKISASKSIVLDNGIPFAIWGPDQVFDITPKDYQYKTLEWFLLQNAKGVEQSNTDTITGIVMPCLDTCHCPACVSQKLLPPMFFINGRDCTTDINEIAEANRRIYYPLPIEKFKKVVLQHLVTGYIAECAIVDRYILHLTLQDGALDAYNSGTLTTSVNGYYNARTFYKPQYDSPKNINKPDYRTTIHWEPNIITNAKGEAMLTYYNADPKTNISIIVEGVKSDGGLVVGSAGYRVK